MPETWGNHVLSPKPLVAQGLAPWHLAAITWAGTFTRCQHPTPATRIRAPARIAVDSTHSGPTFAQSQLPLPTAPSWSSTNPQVSDATPPPRQATDPTQPTNTPPQLPGFGRPPESRLIPHIPGRHSRSSSYPNRPRRPGPARTRRSTMRPRHPARPPTQPRQPTPHLSYPDSGARPNRG